MKYHNTIPFCWAIMAGAIWLGACQRESAPPAPTPTPKPQREVAFVLKTINNPFFVEMRAGALAEASRHPDIKLSIHATATESAVVEQVQLVESLLGKPVAAVCLTPNDSTVAVGLVVKANTQRIPVVIVDTRLNAQEVARQGAKPATFIGSDNVTGGEMAAKLLAQAIKQRGEVALLEGVAGQETAISRRDGFLRGIRKFPDIKVVAQQPANWERDQAYNVMRAILTAHPRLVGAFASNDEMAVGAARAAADMKRDIEIVGFDYTPDGAAAIKTGDLAGSIAQDPKSMGALAVKSAVAAINGQSLPPEQPVAVVAHSKTN
jgi:ABC-type sugar transport system substrate-binding protein